MAHRYRNRAYGYKKPKSFSRYGRPGYGGRPQYYAAQSSPTDVTVAIGNARIWLFNNTDADIVIPAGGYVELRIVSEGQGRVGYRYRAALLDNGRGRGPAPQEDRPEPEERLEDWV